MCMCFAHVFVCVCVWCVWCEWCVWCANKYERQTSFAMVFLRAHWMIRSSSARMFSPVTPFATIISRLRNFGWKMKIILLGWIKNEKMLPHLPQTQTNNSPSNVYAATTYELTHSWHNTNTAPIKPAMNTSHAARPQHEWRNLACIASRPNECQPESHCLRRAGASASGLANDRCESPPDSSDWSTALSRC